MKRNWKQRCGRDGRMLSFQTSPQATTWKAASSRELRMYLANNGDVGVLGLRSATSAWRKMYVSTTVIAMLSLLSLAGGKKMHATPVIATSSVGITKFNTCTSQFLLMHSK